MTNDRVLLDLTCNHLTIMVTECCPEEARAAYNVSGDTCEMLGAVYVGLQVGISQ